MRYALSNPDALLYHPVYGCDNSFKVQSVCQAGPGFKSQLENNISEVLEYESPYTITVHKFSKLQDKSRDIINKLSTILGDMPRTYRRPLNTAEIFTNTT